MSPARKALVVGLGNPGPQYTRTRHNVGFRAVELLAERHSERNWRSKFNSSLCDATSLDALLLLPKTFMNDSGDAVAACAAYYHFEPEQVLVVCDDINLPLARLRFRRSGSDGGHNGLKSIIASLHSENFPRLRIGIGRTASDAIGHVLGVFSSQEEALLPEVLERAARGIEIFLQEGAAAAVAFVNAFGGDPLQQSPDDTEPKNEKTGNREQS